MEIANSREETGKNSTQEVPQERSISPSSNTPEPIAPEGWSKLPKTIFVSLERPSSSATSGLTLPKTIPLLYIGGNFSSLIPNFSSNGKLYVPFS